MAADDRTEQPTARRLEDARKKGQVARSRHVGEAAAMMAALGALSTTGAATIARLGHEVARGFDRVAQSSGHAISSGEVTGIAIEGAAVVGLTVGPVALAAAFAVIGAQAAQSGWNVSTEALQFNLGRLNPVSGFQRFGLKRGGMETLKALLLIVALCWIGWGFVRQVLEQAPELARVSPARAGAQAWDITTGLLWRSFVLLTAIAAADFLYQKHLHIDSLKMTKQEVKDDLRMTDGNPETKGRVRKVMNEMFRRRMMAAVPTATVVITNPTHYAVALQYERRTMAAPVIVAMGKDHVAQRIKAVAREHGVPMVENVALAQALYKTCDLGDTIPAHLFEAVAEVLAYLVRLKQLVI